MQDLCRYWAEDYQWRAAEARLNSVPQYLVGVNGLQVHVLHARSPHPGALPLVLSHGWPGSVLELVGLVGPLTDPVNHGGTPEDAFDVVIPSLPRVRLQRQADWDRLGPSNASPPPGRC